MAFSSSVGFASSIGGLAGASLAAHRGGRAAGTAAVVGAVGLGTLEAVARARQRDGEIPALWQRIAVSTALAAPLGWVLERATGAGPLAVGTATGAVVGVMGVRPEKVALGPVVGIAVGFFGALVMTPVAMFAATQKTGPPTLVSFLPAFWLLIPGALGLVGVAKYLGDERIDGTASLVTAGATMVGIALGVLLGLAAGTRIESLFNTDHPNQAIHT